MKTDWEALSKKLGVLQANGSELYTGQSMQALEGILGDEWIEHAIDYFIEGGKGNELAIKTVRRIQSNKAAEYAYKIFNENKNSDTRKASLALWAMSDIRMPICMQYVEECMGDENYEPIAIAILRNLIYDAVEQYDIEKLNVIFDKVNEKYSDDIAPLKDYANQNLAPLKWYGLLNNIQKRPALYGIQKVEDLLIFHFGYSMAMLNRGIIDDEAEDWNNHFTEHIFKGYSAPSHCNWSTAIRLYSNSDAESVRIFFEELYRYKKNIVDFERLKYREEHKEFCCERMEAEVKNITNKENSIRYNNEEVLKNSYGTGIFTLHNEQIKHCPWCGSRI